MNRLLLLLLLITLQASLRAQEIPFRIVQDSCVTHLITGGKYVFGLVKDSRPQQYAIVQSLDNARTWAPLCSPFGNSYIGVRDTVMQYEQLNCIAADDSVVYCGFGAIPDQIKFPASDTRGSIIGCDQVPKYGSPQLPWFIENLVVHDSLAVYSGSTDAPDMITYTTDHGKSWQYASDGQESLWCDLLCRSGAIMYASNGHGIYVSTDTFRTVARRQLPSGTGQLRALVTRSDGLLLLVISDFQTKHSRFYASLDTAQTWHAVLEDINIPEIESTTFAGDTLLIHLRSSCTVVSVPEVARDSDVRVAIKHGFIVLSGDYGKHLQSTVDIYDTIGRHIQRLSVNCDAASVGRVSFPFIQPLPSVVLVCSSEGWTRLVSQSD